MADPVGFNRCSDVNELVDELLGGACVYHPGDHAAKRECQACLREAFDRAYELGYDFAAEWLPTHEDLYKAQRQIEELRAELGALNAHAQGGDHVSGAHPARRNQ